MGVSIWEYIDLKIKTLRTEGRNVTAYNYSKASLCLKRYCANDSLSLQDITEEFADRLLIESGTYNSLDHKRDADKTLLEQGKWPAAWYRDFETDVHPNTYGYHAYAIMVYEKMRELGYLDE